MGKSSRTKRQGAPAVGSAVLWGVLIDGQLGSYLFPDQPSARAAATRLHDEMPASVIEWAQIGVTLLMRRPLRPKIQVVRLAAP